MSLLFSLGHVSAVLGRVDFVDPVHSTKQACSHHIKSMSAAEVRRTDTLPSSTEERLRGQTNPQDRSETSVSESSSRSSAVKALDVAGRQQSLSAAKVKV